MPRLRVWLVHWGPAGRRYHVLVQRVEEFDVAKSVMTGAAFLARCWHDKNLGLAG